MRRRTPLSIEVKKVLKLLMFTLIGLLVTTSAYFFVKTSNTAEKGYALRENQVLKHDLESENRILKQKLLETQSLSELKQSDVVKSMAEPTNPIYIEPKGPLTKRR